MSDTYEFPGTVYYYNSSNPYIDDNVRKIQMQLAIRSYLSNSDVDSWFGPNTEKAVKEFQKNNALQVTGEVDKATWEKLFSIDIESDDSENSTETDTQYDTDITYGSNNYDSFFNENNNELFRKNNNDITITYGNGYKYKILKNVIFRSKTQQVNANGEPIADVYEFIARDLIESEEQ